MQEALQELSAFLQKVPPEKAQTLIEHITQFLEEQNENVSRIERLTMESARRQFFKAIYDRDYDLVHLLLKGSRKKYVNSNLICSDDRWTALHACLYKYNQYTPQDTLRIVQLLLDHNADVNQPCPDGAVAINVLDKKPLPNGQQNGPDNLEREKKTVSFQNKMVLDVAIDFLQAYKWAGCRPSVLENWKPLIELLDKASLQRKKDLEKQHDLQYALPPPSTIKVDVQYQKNFRKLLKNEIATDVVLICNNINNHEENYIKAHKCILMASSPVFYAMFSSKMQENIQSQVRMDDVPIEAVNLMLEFMYCGDLPTTEFQKDLHIAVSVLCLADKYNMEDLKLHCEWHLHYLLNIQTALPILISARRYNADRLYQQTLNYVCTKFHEISKKEEFSQFSQEYPLILQQILSKVTQEYQLRPHKRLKMALSDL